MDYLRIVSSFFIVSGMTIFLGVSAPFYDPTEVAREVYEKFSNNLLEIKDIHTYNPAYFCSEALCDHFYVEPFPSPEALKQHLAEAHFICVDCQSYCGTRANFLQHCEEISHMLYCRAGVQKNDALQLSHSENHDESPKGKEYGSARRGRIHLKRNCLVRNCQYHTNPLSSFPNLKLHLANQHNICCHCYNKHGLFRQFDSRRELVQHFISESQDDATHTIYYCKECFLDETVKDLDIVLSIIPSKLEKHIMRMHSSKRQSKRRKSASGRNSVSIEIKFDEEDRRNSC